jgi:hypothetical protein
MRDICPYCKATMVLGGFGSVHGDLVPCPLKLSESEALVAMLDAQRLMFDAQRVAHERSGFVLNDAAAMMRKMRMLEEEDDG